MATPHGAAPALGIVSRYDTETLFTPGISYKYNDSKTGITNTISLAEKESAEKFRFLFEGYIKIDKDGPYTFFLSSDDGSNLFIDDVQIIDNGGDHGMVEKSGKAFLRKGFHKIKISYFDSGGDNGLKLSMQAEDGTKKEVPAAALYH